MRCSTDSLQAARAPTGNTDVYDSANNRMIVFGGIGLSVTTFFDDVWVLTYANGQGGAAAWIQLSPTVLSRPRETLHDSVDTH